MTSHRVVGGQSEGAIRVRSRAVAPADWSFEKDKTMSNDLRLDLLKDAIVMSGLDAQTKDALADDLKYAQDINGDDDAALRGIKRLVISGVRRELIAHQRITEALEMHTEACARRRAEEIKAVVEALKIENAAKEDSIGVRGMQVCGKAALIVAAGVALALIILAATGRLPW